MNIKSILEELAIRTEWEPSGQTCFINPQWRVTTEAGANIWGTWDTPEEANEGCADAKRMGQKNINQVILGIGVVEFDDGQFLLIHSDDGMPILRADIGDGETLRLLVEQFTKRDSATDFHQWAQKYASVYCSDTTIVGS